jgi:hypothetical protein
MRVVVVVLPQAHSLTKPAQRKMREKNQKAGHGMCARTVFAAGCHLRSLFCSMVGFSPQQPQAFNGGLLATTAASIPPCCLNTRGMSNKITQVDNVPYPGTNHVIGAKSGSSNKRSAATTKRIERNESKNTHTTRRGYFKFVDTLRRIGHPHDHYCRERVALSRDQDRLERNLAFIFHQSVQQIGDYTGHIPHDKHTRTLCSTTPLVGSDEPVNG